MTAAQLDRGCIERLTRQDIKEGPFRLQISSLLKKDNSKYACSLSDGVSTLAAITSSQVSKQVEAGEINNWNIVSVTNFTCNSNAGTACLVVLGCEVVAECDGPLGPPATPSTSKQQADDITPAAKKVKVEPEQTQARSTAAQSPVKPGTAVLDPAPSMALAPDAQPAASPVPTGAGARQSTPHAEKENHPANSRLQTPAAAVKPLGWGTTPDRPGPTPPSTGRSLGPGRPTQPIQALNPYNCAWTIKARIANKAPKRSYSRNGADSSLFSVELIDSQGTQIEATLWREAADRYYDVLEEGKVYYFSKGKVKPANRNFAGVRNDYTINFDREASVEECTDADDVALSQMQAKLQYVGIERLPNHIGKKVPVDLIGIVTSTGPLGSVKRKSDSSEVPRRDVTLVDQSKKTVQVTLWGAAAEDAGGTLEGLEGTSPVLSISNCRVTDFNGVSVSALQRSVVAVNPDSSEAAELRDWWDTEGVSAPTQHAGEGLPSARKGSGGSARGWSQLKDIQRDAHELPSADAKPEYYTITATVVLIEPGQSLYYQACPENNRKVVQQGDGWLCEYNGQVYPAMVRRYVCLAKCSDATGEATLSFFNDQAETLIRMKADDIAPLKEGDNQQLYESALKNAQWGDWVLQVQSRVQEYNGEARQRLSVQALEPLDYVKESRRILDQLARS